MEWAFLNGPSKILQIFIILSKKSFCKKIRKKALNYEPKEVTRKIFKSCPRACHNLSAIT